MDPPSFFPQFPLVLGLPLLRRPVFYLSCSCVEHMLAEERCSFPLYCPFSLVILPHVSSGSHLLLLYFYPIVCRFDQPQIVLLSYHTNYSSSPSIHWLFIEPQQTGLASSFLPLPPLSVALTLIPPCLSPYR